MEAAGELKWDIEPYNGRNCFFSRESYEKYNLGPTPAELLLLSNKPSSEESEHTPSKTDPPEPFPAVPDVPAAFAAPAPTKSIPPFPEPCVPYPHFSSLSALEQDTYVKLMIKFINSAKHTVNVLQMKEYNHFEFLKSKASSEHAEFQKFLQNAARSCVEDYNVLPADAALYIQEMIKSCQVYVTNYPKLYAVQDITSLLGGKFIPDLSLNLEKCLLKLGSVDFVKVRFPTEDIPLTTSYRNVSRAMPPSKKAGRIQKSVTSDSNTAKLVSKYCPQVVLTAQALYTLLNNHGPAYTEQWEIPIRVETSTGAGGKPLKVVYVDSPLPKKQLSTREKSQMYHEVVLDQFMLKNSRLALNAVFLDKKEEEWHADREYKDRKLACVRKEVDFENDVTEFETFGSMEVDKSEGETEKMEETICQEPSEVSKEPMTAVQSFTSHESHSDSDEDRLVIAVDCQKSSDTNTMPSKSTIQSPPKRTSRRIPKDVGPLGQILKMQAQLLKPGTKKIEPSSKVDSERNEQQTDNPQHVQPPVGLPSELSQETQRKDATNVSRGNRKLVLSNDLLQITEDDTEYTVEANDNNFVYKLFSLEDMLLLLQSTVHTAITARSSNKRTKKQTPVFVLTKMNYQYCYGVESLTESEICRLWTESLVHSNCTLFVGHVDALTSKFFMLEEITANKLKENVGIFKPANCMNILRHILKWLTNVQDGSYLLSHASNDASVSLYKSEADKKRGSYNLHEAHSGPPKPPVSLSVPWVPLNPNLLLSYHIQHGRPPCTFPPALAVNPAHSKETIVTGGNPNRHWVNIQTPCR
ncbi:little elongation complex subunit 2 isoform X2 [Hyperolius riggenbachi]|uniref:little elongation complex subunit 2 isoform X2 n=1 Tax=Hyperolius riggenbachi TaxID=752182 RepID=UPI0035A2C015